MTASDLHRQLISLEAKLDDAMRLFATFEEKLNTELKAATASERSTIFARRNAYESSFGIERLVETIATVRDRLAAVERHA